MKRIYLLSFLILLLAIGCEDKNAKTVFDLTFQPAEVNFGKVEIYTSVDTVVTLTNESTSSGAFTGILKIMDTNGYSFNSSKEITLEKGESIDITLTFEPQALQDYIGRFTIIRSDLNPDFFYEMPITGTGAGPVRFSIPTTKLIFGLVKPGEHKDLDVTVQNATNSGFDLEITLQGISGDFSLPDGKTSYTIAIGRSIDIPVRYTPSQLSASGSLEIHHNSSLGNNPVTIELSGTKDQSGDIITDIQNGWTKFQSGDYSGALSDFVSAQTITASNVLYDSLEAEALLGSGWSHAYLRSYNLAQSDFTDSYQNHTTIASGTLVDCRAGLAIIENLRGKYTKVIDHATFVLTTSPNYVFQYKTSIDHLDILLARAQAYYNTGDFVNAAKDLDTLDPDNAPHSTDPRLLLAALQSLSGSF
jgi:hypothetical protein